MADKIYLADVVAVAAGWPIDLSAVGMVLDMADQLLPGGRAHHDPLTDDQLGALGFRRAA